jgi:hypothetical protein
MVKRIKRHEEGENYESKERIILHCEITGAPTLTIVAVCAWLQHIRVTLRFPCYVILRCSNIVFYHLVSISLYTSCRNFEWDLDLGPNF